MCCRNLLPHYSIHDMKGRFFAHLSTFMFLDCALAFNYTQCSIDVKAAYSRNPKSVSLRSSTGQPVAIDSNAWGVSYADCDRYCGNGHEPFDWNVFANGISLWLLPWLALTAQLSYETRSGRGNFEAFYLAVGSPMVVVHSLCISALNSRWINENFRQTREKVDELPADVFGAIERENLLKTLDYAREVAIATQHNAVSILQDYNEQNFAELFEDRQSREIWWQVVREELKKTQRKW